VPDKKTIDELKAAHGTIYGKKIDGVEFVFRECTREELRTWVNNQGADRFAANEVLACAAVVLPTGDELISIFDGHAAFIEELAGEILQNTGVVQGEPVRKIEHPDHGPCFTKTIEDRTYLFTLPRRTEMHRVSKKRETDLFKATELLCAAGAVHPAGEDLTALLEKRPGHIMSLGTAIQAEAAVGESDEAKKL